MNGLEDELRKALRREEPPEGFAERALARSRATKRASIDALVGRGLRWALAGTMCLILALAAFEHRRARQEMARGEAAKAQLMLALRITGSKLQIAQAKVQLRGNPPNNRN